MENNIGFMQIAEQTDEEKLAMYMKCTKRKLAEMLIQCNKLLDVQLGNCRFKEYPEPLQGWICPRCGQVHSPFSLVCGCSPPTITSNTVEFRIEAEDLIKSINNR